MKTLTLGLIKGRHEMAVKEYIFEQSTIDPFNYGYMKATIHQKLVNCNKLHLYVTGLTQALVEVINYCVTNKITLSLYHFNRDTMEYQKQTVFTTTLKDSEWRRWSMCE